jgi:pimeloyl-ACP methyl ester carboxylesterase
MNAKPRPFAPEIAAAEIADLHRRLGQARIVDAQPGAPPWSLGFEADALREILHRWRHDFDWRAAERRLAEGPSYMLRVGEEDVHIVHRRSPHPNAFPLVLTHGWPGSVFELLGLLDPLCEPTAHGGNAGDAFDVVVVSIPGFGFSPPPSRPGYDAAALARTMAGVMAALGYERYGTTGGDWGAMAATRLALQQPERLVGLHLSMVMVARPRDPRTGRAVDNAQLTTRELAALEEARTYMSTGTAYQAAQTLEPDTVGRALDDSPAGLAAWILSKFLAWSDDVGGTRPGLFDRFDADDLLANLSLYWLTRSATTAARLYYESALGGTFGPHQGKVTVPTGVALFPRELFRPPRAWVEQAFNLRRWTEMPRGGHFASLEAPEDLVADLRAFFRDLR